MDPVANLVCLAVAVLGCALASKGHGLPTIYAAFAVSARGVRAGGRIDPKRAVEDPQARAGGRQHPGFARLSLRRNLGARRG